jgi:hypothetical protein
MPLVATTSQWSRAGRGMAVAACRRRRGPAPLGELPKVVRLGLLNDSGPCRSRRRGPPRKRSATTRRGTRKEARGRPSLQTVPQDLDRCSCRAGTSMWPLARGGHAGPSLRASRRTYCTARVNERGVSQAVVVATGVSTVREHVDLPTGGQEICPVVALESARGWPPRWASGQGRPHLTPDRPALGRVGSCHRQSGAGHDRFRVQVSRCPSRRTVWPAHSLRFSSAVCGSPWSTGADLDRHRVLAVREVVGLFAAVEVGPVGFPRGWTTPVR